MALWRIAVQTRDFQASDLSGKGAEKTGGRWNRPGLAVVYTASTISLACLETVVHLNADDLPLNRFLVRIDVPSDVWAARGRLGTHDLPAGRNALPAGKVSRDIGDEWLHAANTALLAVPSAIVPEELNVLINPAHPQAPQITAVTLRPWFYDNRLA